MRKNKMMRLASVLLVMTMLTTCAISGTFAKYTTQATGTDTARVAYWGFDNTDGKLLIDELFVDTYNDTVDSKDGKDVIAPGTTKSDTFEFQYTDNTGIGATAPEVEYDFTISVAGSVIDDAIKNNTNIKWKLDTGAYGTWDELMTSILRLSGNDTVTYVKGTTESVTVRYQENTIPAAFVADTEHTITWDWAYSVDEAGDKADTAMGNKADLDDVTVTIAITATQVD